MENFDLVRMLPIFIVAGGAFIASLIIVYYGVKELALSNARSEIKKDVVDEEIEYTTFKTYEIHFMNGSVYKFGGVNLIIKYDKDDPNTITSFEYGYEEDIDEMSETAYAKKYSQRLRFIDYSEILYIRQEQHMNRV